MAKENLHLRTMLNEHGIAWQEKMEVRPAAVMDKQAEEQRRINLFMKLFVARRDVYAKRWETTEGRKGYSPVCANFWQDVCPKRLRKPVKCNECNAHKWQPFTEQEARQHLLGTDEKGKSFVAGTYALLEDSTCKFLAFDFDDHDGSACYWQDEALGLRKICHAYGIDSALERSRSGNGAHVWLFFAQPIAAKTARLFGRLLLGKGAEVMHQTDFNTFDRMLPNQDEMPAGGLGNLIALPLQGLPRKQHNSVFVDENWQAVADQWGYLANIKPLTADFVAEKIKAWSESKAIVVQEECADYTEQSRPWEGKRVLSLEAKDFTGKLQITLANCIYIPKAAVKPRSLNRIRQLATFSNPQFYKMQAMHYSTKQIPRRIQCFREVDDYVTLPRGLLTDLTSLLSEAKVPFVFEDCRNQGKAIKVSFKGKLQPGQQEAADVMLAHDGGILGAATGFGKTVLGTYLIARRKVNTLILVHNRELMRQWQQDIEKFLQIDEVLPIIKGKRKTSIVGTLYSGRDSLHGIVDIAMISSLGRDDDVDERLQDYGMVIMDECHHAGAATFENVLWNVKAKYVYGLTATPVRDDGHEKIMFMQLGPLRYRLTEKERGKMQDFRHEIYPRFTAFAPVTTDRATINDFYKLLIGDKERNALLLADILNSLAEGRTPLVLTKFKEHAEYIYEQLQAHDIYAVLLLGGGSAKERQERQNRLHEAEKQKKIAIIATGKYIGEGFNFPRLDTLFLTVPISWKGNLAQYAGRLHRDFSGKENVIIYDYVDVHVKMLERMYQKRLKAYAAMGYALFATTGEGNNVIYTVNDYQDVFGQDFSKAAKRICISSPWLSHRRVAEFIKRINDLGEPKPKITVITLPDEVYSDKQQNLVKRSKKAMTAAGVIVEEHNDLNCHYAVFDDDLVWYGSMNFLSKEHDDDLLLRIRSELVAKELLGRKADELEQIKKLTGE
ncbi:TOTE conflict system archaeo-eukaryotic primase domain-containing protein [Selenomonas ruminantium]|uniref:TOTE conflict system archaeo-eukaryotic primase domain-containing protein n=1 Tax=Selenomonas ruminantium TaxID=971 RepID=UPI00115F83C2|nr:DEAD/DEAH box helicase family protein [Selenomonas ruminantium]